MRRASSLDSRPSQPFQKYAATYPTAKQGTPKGRDPVGWVPNPPPLSRGPGVCLEEVPLGVRVLLEEPPTPEEHRRRRPAARVDEGEGGDGRSLHGGVTWKGIRGWIGLGGEGEEELFVCGGGVACGMGRVTRYGWGQCRRNTPSKEVPPNQKIL